MPVGDTAFSTSVFSVDVSGVGRHPNPVTCVVRGRRGPLTVVGQGQSVTGDIVIIRPGVEHHIVCGEGGLSAMYLDGARWPGRWLSPGTLAERLGGRLGELALAGMQLEFRCAAGAARASQPRSWSSSPGDERRTGGLGGRTHDEDEPGRISQTSGIGAHPGASIVQGFDRDDLPPIQAVDWTAACCASDRSWHTRENSFHGCRLRRHCTPHPDLQTMLRTDAVPGNRRFTHDRRLIGGLAAATATPTRLF